MNTLSTAYGPGLASAAAPLLLPADPSAALAKAAAMRWLADLHQNEERGRQADRFSQLALGLRCRALGVWA